jgi:hypothetical protein
MESIFINRIVGPIISFGDLKCKTIEKEEDYTVTPHGESQHDTDSRQTLIILTEKCSFGRLFALLNGTPSLSTSMT